MRGWGLITPVLPYSLVCVCVSVCVRVHIQIHIHTQIFFLASVDIFSGSRKGEEFFKTIILVCKMVTLDRGNLIDL